MKKADHKSFWLGIDLAKQTLAAALAPQGALEWRKLPGESFTHTPEGVAALLAWVEQRLGAHGHCAGVVVEATGRLHERFEDLWRQAGATAGIHVANPAHTAAFAKSQGVRDKRDASDAALLALFGAQRQPKPSAPESPEQGQLRELDRLRQQLVEDRTRWRNRLGEVRSPAARQQIEKTIAQLGEQIKELERQMDELIKRDQAMAQQVELLHSVPGIGPVSARTLTAELGDLRQITRNRLVARAGLFPLAEESGTSVHRRPRLAKGGGGRVRKVLYMGATSLMRSKDEGIKQVGTRLCGQGRPTMVALGAVMRKLLLVGRAVVCSGKPYEATQAGRSKPAGRRGGEGFVPVGQALKNMFATP